MLPIEQGIKPPKLRKVKPVPDSAQSAMNEYCEVYRRLYGRKPIVEYDKTVNKVNVDGAMVSPKRLRELTVMMKRRIEP